MGMYTGIWVECLIKPEFRPAIAEMMAPAREEEKVDGWKPYHQRRRWDAVVAQHAHIPELQEWLQRCHDDRNRADWIPGLSGPEETNASNMTYPFDWPGQHVLYEEPKLSFTTSLKNYHQDIQAFIRLVLPHIAESVQVCQSIYCEFVNHDGPTETELYAVEIKPYPPPRLLT